MRRILTFLAAVVALHASSQNRLVVSADHRSLQYENGVPFFWLGDTAWEIIGKLTPAEMRFYLDDRAAKGFNVIQVMNLSDHDIAVGDRNGERPFHGDPLRPNEKYYVGLDSLVAMARSRKLVIALVVAWGEYDVSPGANGTPLFDSLTAYSYGKWIGTRYKSAQNIVWIMGGDRPPYKDNIDRRPVWRAMAKGIKESAGDQSLITYHPNGERSSSQWLHNEPWLSFNMIQSSHGRKDSPTWDMVHTDWSKEPAKPTLDSEPNYEDHPINPWPVWKVEYGYFRDHDVRKQLYRSVFAGGAGVTYGHHAIWQFMSERDEVINFADRGWLNAMQRPGATQAGYVRKLMESRPLIGRTPDNSIIVAGQGEKGERVEAFRGKDNSYCMVYSPVAKELTLNTTFFKSPTLTVWWFDPATGKVGNPSTINKGPAVRFSPPVGTELHDWVVIVDDPSARFGAPGQSIYSAGK